MVDVEFSILGIEIKEIGKKSREVWLEGLMYIFFY